MLINKIRQCQNLLDVCDPSSKSNYVFHRLFKSQLNLFTRTHLVDKFWNHFQDKLNRSNPDSHKPLIQAVDILTKSYKEVESLLTNSKNDEFQKKFLATLKSQILSHKCHNLEEYLEATYFRAFRAYLEIDLNETTNESMQVDSAGDTVNEDEDHEMDEYDDVDHDDTSPRLEKQNLCRGCSQAKDKCDCTSIYDNFCRMNSQLRDLGILEGLVGQKVLDISRVFIERRVSTMGKSNYSYSYLQELTSWVQRVVKNWIAQIYGIKEAQELEDIGLKLDQYLKDSYAEVRVAHMFEIIIEYPNSEAAIQDLKLCLDESTSSNFRLNLIDSVKQSLIESLLHPGVNTYDILTAYISAIKALRALDQTGLILQLVTEPVRRYLKSRDDTVRCIVTALTDEDHNSELNREMIRSGTQTNENGTYEKNGNTEMSLPYEGERCTASNFDKWKPDPIKLSSADDVMKSSRFSDIVSILVNIYETKDLFVEEYQKLLSQRLLNKYYECNLDTELRNLELLTLRFSDCELHRCEVMLKDVQTSKRINRRILSGDIRNHKIEKFKSVDALIVSSPFWPEKFSPIASLSDEAPKIEFPPEIEEAISTYTKAFESIQASRTLHWRHHLGQVNLDLTINGKTQNFTVSPLHVALLYLFKEKKSWRLNEICHKTSIPAATIRSKLALWQRNGLIRDCGEDRYDLIEE